MVAILRPLRKIVISSEISRMSSRKCEMKIKPRPLAFELDQNFEQPLDFRRRQSGGRLVENDDPRAREKHAGKLDELLHADRKVAEPGARDRCRGRGSAAARVAWRAMRRQATMPSRFTGCTPRKTFSATVRSGATESS